jgi:hypothetical protein
MLMKQFADVRGAGVKVSDFQTFKDDAGFSLQLPGIYLTEFTAGGAVSRGDTLIWDHSDAATTPLRVAQAGAAAPGYTIIGVSMNDATVNEYVQVCVFGFCWVKVGTADPVATDWGSPSGATAGVVAVQTGDVLETTVAGEHLGHFLGVEDADNLAPFWFYHF